MKNDLSKDIENNFYIPDILFDSIEKKECNDIINTHRLNHDFKFLQSNSIGTQIKTINYENYYKEYIK